MLNMYAQQNRAIKYMKQKLIELKADINRSTLTAGDFNTPLLGIDRLRRQKISENIKDQ